MAEENDLISKHEAVIGLEIHAELATASKMFCACANEPLAAANTNVCPICMGFPGTLPVPNKKAIELTLKVGKALNCQRASESKFDRKNYFYPDLPKGYQISQYDLPLAWGGSMTVEGSRILIRRVHLEEDTGKNIHQEGKDASLVDYNRAGVPLIEIVTEPDITSARKASAFAKEFQLVLRYLQASAADMEKGQMRVEANVSVRRTETNEKLKMENRELGTKVEIKNLNSFRSVEKSIEYEIQRQIELLERGEKITQETRGWDEAKQQTFSQRTKEEAEDYRYFPEPDIPPIDSGQLSVASDEEIKLPEEIRSQLISIGLSDHDAQVLSSNKTFTDFFNTVLETSKAPAKTVANWLINEGIETQWGAESVAKLIARVHEGKITAAMAKEAIKKAKETGKLEIPQDVQVISDHGQLATIIDEVIAANERAVQEYKNGKKETLGFLVGQVMRQTAGQASPQTVNELLKKKLGEV